MPVVGGAAPSDGGGEPAGERREGRGETEARGIEASLGPVLGAVGGFPHPPAWETRLRAPPETHGRGRWAERIAALSQGPRPGRCERRGREKAGRQPAAPGAPRGIGVCAAEESGVRLGVGGCARLPAGKNTVFGVSSPAQGYKLLLEAFRAESGQAVMERRHKELSVPLLRVCPVLQPHGISACQKSHRSVLERGPASGRTAIGLFFFFSKPSCVLFLQRVVNVVCLTRASARSCCERRDLNCCGEHVCLQRGCSHHLHLLTSNCRSVSVGGVALKDGSVLGFVQLELMAGLGSGPRAAIQRAKSNWGSAEIFAG